MNCVAITFSSAGLWSDWCLEWWGGRIFQWFRQPHFMLHWWDSWNQFLYQRLSISLQKGNAACICRPDPNFDWLEWCHLVPAFIKTSIFNAPRNEVLGLKKNNLLFIHTLLNLNRNSKVRAVSSLRTFSTPIPLTRPHPHAVRRQVIIISNCRLVPYWREFLGVSWSRTRSDLPFANT